MRESRFLTPQSLEPMNTEVPARELNEPTTFTDRAQAGEQCLAIFRDLHRTHYLKSLKILGGRAPNQDTRLKVDDVVIIPDKIASTGLPALGIVTDVEELDATVRYSSKFGKRLSVKRPQEKMMFLLTPHASKRPIWTLIPYWQMMCCPGQTQPQGEYSQTHLLFLLASPLRNSFTGGLTCTTEDEIQNL